MTETKPHHGRNIKRFREWVGVKQETLAAELHWSQQKMSLFEQKEEIEDPILEEVAKILKVPLQAIKNLDDAGAVNYFNTFNDSSFNNGAFNAYNCTFNPLEKFIEAMEENKKLYQQLLKEKDAMIEELKKLISR
jgi:DNA-binding XRE family transcriptional regulator